MSGWVFLSHVLEPATPVYGNQEGLGVTATRSIARGDTANTARLSLPNHLGTHVDAPRHFFEEGRAVDSYDAGFWRFEWPVLVDCPKDPDALVRIDDIAPRLGAAEPGCLLLRTSFERFRGETTYWERNPGIHPEVAPWLRGRYPSVRLVGIDAISISSWRQRDLGRQTHRAFLDERGEGGPVLLLEDVSLAPIAPGASLAELVVAPLRIRGADGSPCTVMGRIE